MRFTKLWWKDTIERTLTAGGAVMAAWLVDAITKIQSGTSIGDLSWKAAIAASVGTAIVYFCKCVLATTVGDPQSASLARTVATRDMAR